MTSPHRWDPSRRRHRLPLSAQPRQGLRETGGGAGRGDGRAAGRRCADQRQTDPRAMPDRAGRWGSVHQQLRAEAGALRPALRARRQSLQQRGQPLLRLCPRRKHRRQGVVDLLAAAAHWTGALGNSCLNPNSSPSSGSRGEVAGRVPSIPAEVNATDMTEPVREPSTPLRPSVLRRLSIAQLSARLTRFAAVDPRFMRVLARDPRHGVRHLAARLRAIQTRAARESARLDGLFTVEREQRAQGFAAIAGVDEVGVAPLAGPVVAAAVILPAGVSLPHLDDSKRLTAAQRDVLYEQITACAVACQIGMATVEEIDRLNILQATRLAHRRAILGFAIRPQLVLIDGRYAADVT